jgi:hypothetical protein
MTPEQLAAFRQREQEQREEKRKEEEREKKLLAPLRLSPDQTKLFLLLAHLRVVGAWRGGGFKPSSAVEVSYLVEQIRGGVWERLGPRNRDRALRRLRNLKHRLNEKLRAAGWTLRVIRRGSDCLEIVDGTNPRKDEGAPSAETLELFNKLAAAVPYEDLPLPDGPFPTPKRRGATGCADYIRSLLTARGEMGVGSLRCHCSHRGYSPATVKRARKRLGVVARKEGYGSGSLWIVSLPPKR